MNEFDIEIVNRISVAIDDLEELGCFNKTRVKYILIGVDLMSKGSIRAGQRIMGIFVETDFQNKNSLSLAFEISDFSDFIASRK